MRFYELIKIKSLPCIAEISQTLIYPAYKSVLQDELEHYTSPKPFGMLRQHLKKSHLDHLIQHQEQSPVPPPKICRQEELTLSWQGEQTTDGEIYFGCAGSLFLSPAKWAVRLFSKFQNQHFC